MSAFLENAQRIFDVASSDAGGEPHEFALLVKPDGGLHFVMESTVSLEAAAAEVGASAAYRVTKSGNGGVKVFGREGDQLCTFEREARRLRTELLRDQPLYRIHSPVTSAPALPLVAC